MDDQLNRLGARNKSLKRELKMYQAVVKVGLPLQETFIYVISTHSHNSPPPTQTCENMLTYYGLDSAEIFLAARASATHYGKNPPSPFISAPERQPGLGHALEALEKEARNTISEVPSSSYIDVGGITDELSAVVDKIQMLRSLVAANKPVPVVMPSPLHRSMSGAAHEYDKGEGKA